MKVKKTLNKASARVLNCFSFEGHSSLMGFRRGGNLWLPAGWWSVAGRTSAIRRETALVFACLITNEIWRGERVHYHPCHFPSEPTPSPSPTFLLIFLVFFSEKQKNRSFHIVKIFLNFISIFEIKISSNNYR